MASFEHTAYIVGSTLPHAIQVQWNGAVNATGVKKLAVDGSGGLLTSTALFDLLEGATDTGRELGDFERVDVDAATVEGVACFYARPVAGACVVGV